MRRRLFAAAAAAGLAILTYCATPLAAQAAGNNQHAHDVRALVHNADGTSTFTIWTPAEGASAQQLYQSLKAAGTPGLIDYSVTTGDVTIMEPVDCSIQGAYALNKLCGINQYHWSGTHPAVYFLDHTSAAWPVDAAVIKWNQSTALDSVYRWYTSGCPSTNHCVHLYNANYGPVPWVGSTSFTTSGTVITGATIKFNDHSGSGYIPPSDAKWHRETSCHETGHALGLDHNLFETSCLYFQHTSSRSQYPGPGDWLVLQQIY